MPLAFGSPVAAERPSHEPDQVDGDPDLPPKKWSRDPGVRRPGLHCVDPRIRWAEHPKRRVPAPGVVEELDVVVDRICELDPGLPAFAVEELDLHPPPERLDHRIVVGAADGSHRGSEASVSHLAAESPGGELLDLGAFYGAYKDDGWGRAAFEPR